MAKKWLIIIRLILLSTSWPRSWLRSGDGFRSWPRSWSRSWSIKNHTEDILKHQVVQDPIAYKKYLFGYIYGAAATNESRKSQYCCEGTHLEKNIQEYLPLHWPHQSTKHLWFTMNSQHQNHMKAILRISKHAQNQWLNSSSTND